MKNLIQLAQIPFPIWLLISVFWGWYSYDEWDQNTFQPLKNEVAGLKSELLTLQQRNARVEEFNKKREEKLKELQELGEAFKKTSNRLPRTENIPEILKALADLSDSIGLQFSSFTPGSFRKDQFIRITPLDVEIEGTYPQIMSFLDGASNMERIVKGNKATFEGPRLRGNATMLKVKAQLETYSISDSDMNDSEGGDDEGDSEGDANDGQAPQ